MKRCQSCGYLIEGTPREVLPESTSGARQAVYLHPTREECRKAADQRLVSSPQHHP